MILTQLQITSRFAAMNTAIQDNIKKHLHAKNMTAAELERRTGIPHAVVNILHGRSKNPSLRTAQAIAKELGCSVDDLFTVNPPRTQAAPPTANPNTKQDYGNSWDPKLYAAVVTAVLNTIATINITPDAAKVAHWITEVYQYTLGSPESAIDQRFVRWLVEK